jgi:hypothetical protein
MGGPSLALSTVRNFHLVYVRLLFTLGFRVKGRGRVQGVRDLCLSIPRGWKVWA